MAIQETLEFSSPPPPSCSSDSNPKRYDVFLTFRGEDTRKNFTDHLFAALDREGIYTFRDNEELERGKNISTSIFQAIEQSWIALVVLSRNYASSTRCLDEILKIVECMNQMGQTVLPVFYDVDPSDVRRQTGSFAGAFDAHEQHFKDGLNKVQRWRDTLTQIANIGGFHLQNRYVCMNLGLIGS